MFSNKLLGGNIMKINKSILTGMTALSLFATSAAAATSAVTPVVSNAAVKKSAVKHTYKFNWLMKAESKGHATHYYNTVEKFHVTKKQMKKGMYWAGEGVYPYVQPHHVIKYRLKGNRIVRVTKNVTTYANTKHQSINDKRDFLGDGTYRISKAEFNKLNKEQTR